MTLPPNLLRFRVPAPETALRLGHGGLGASPQVDGVAAHTRGHVWMSAEAAGTFTAHARDLVRVISDTDQIYLAAKLKVVVATEGGLSVASKGALKIMAGHAADPGLHDPAEDLAPPDAADQVRDSADLEGTIWGAADGVFSVLYAARMAGAAVLPASGPRAAANLAAVGAATGVLTTLTATGNQTTALGDGGLAGIQISGTGGINLGTPGGAVLFGTTSVLYASPYSAQLLGLMGFGMIGLAMAGMSSLGKVDLSSAGGVGVEAQGPVTVQALAGQTVLKGSSVGLGQVLPDPMCPAQLPTLSIGLTAMTGMRVRSPSGDVRFGRVPEDILEEMGVLGFVSALESVEQAKETLSETSSAVTALANVKAGGLGLVKDAPQALMALELPPLDPVFTMMNDTQALAGAVFFAKESAILRVDPWTVEVSADGIKLFVKAGTATVDVNADGIALSTKPFGVTVKSDKAEIGVFPGAAEPILERRLRRQNAAVPPISGITITDNVEITGFAASTMKAK